jgi:hypothetical protein
VKGFDKRTEFFFCGAFEFLLIKISTACVANRGAYLLYSLENISGNKLDVLDIKPVIKTLAEIAKKLRPQIPPIQ